MSEKNPLAAIDQLITLAQDARQEADRLYNQNIKKAATDYRKTLQEITNIIKEERPRALEHSKNIPKKK